ncbi:MAG TPA: YtxH domain-containing protein [Candidatus Gastranaerophilales bacterium]|nr:YtxH domain-containing protein [Candidatus Gastranaerophilales bacterium]
MSKNSDDYLIFTVGTLLGVLSGVIAGIVFSPKSGEEMRKDLKNIASNICREVPSETETAKKSFIKIMDKLKYTLEGQLGKINEALKAGRMASAKRKEELDVGY